MKQRTVLKKTSVIGIGLHSGEPVKLTLEPMNEGGIIFYRSDKGVTIPGSYEYVTDTRLATVLGKDGVTLSTVEHLLSAMSAFGIDHLRIVVDGPEIPIMDGSASSFIMLLNEAGIKELDKPKSFFKITKKVEIEKDGKLVRLEPAEQIIFDYTIKFQHPVIATQKKIYKFSLNSYIKEIAKARTFGFLKEVQYLRSVGLALGGSLDNAVVLDDKKILNESLRYEDEFVRHKILDAIGDLRLLGYNFIGKYTSFKGSHHLNSLLVKKVIEEKAYEIVKFDKNKNAGVFSLQSVLNV